MFLKSSLTSWVAVAHLVLGVLKVRLVKWVIWGTLLASWPTQFRNFIYSSAKSCSKIMEFFSFFSYKTIWNEWKTFSKLVEGEEENYAQTKLGLLEILAIKKSDFIWSKHHDKKLASIHSTHICTHQFENLTLPLYKESLKFSVLQFTVLQSVDF